MKRGFKKMYLIDPKHVKLDKPEVEQSTLERRINDLDLEMTKISKDDTIGDEEKLRLYLETLRKHIMGTKQFERLSREPVPVTVVDKKSKAGGNQAPSPT